MDSRNSFGKRRKFEIITRPILKTLGAASVLAGRELGHIEWKDQTYVPRREKYVGDLVGTIEDGSMLHIEQETSPKPDLRIRMLEYACLIAVDTGMERSIRQILYYTGDEPLGFDAIERRKMGYLSHKFEFVDAGSTEICQKFFKAQFPAAALALLIRDSSHVGQIADHLARRIQRLPAGNLDQAVVDCLRVASLRRRSQIMEDALLAHLPEYDPEIILNPTLARRMERDYRDLVKKTIPRLAFPLSEELTDFLLREADYLELKIFLEATLSASSEQEIVSALEFQQEDVGNPFPVN